MRFKFFVSPEGHVHAYSVDEPLQGPNHDAMLHFSSRYDHLKQQRYPGRLRWAPQARISESTWTQHGFQAVGYIQVAVASVFSITAVQSVIDTLCKVMDDPPTDLRKPLPAILNGQPVDETLVTVQRGFELCRHHLPQFGMQLLKGNSPPPSPYAF